MKIVFSFTNKFSLNIFPDSFEFKNGLILNEEHYDTIRSPIGFELGFYNFLIDKNKLIGINLQFNHTRIDIDNFFKKNQYVEVDYIQDELFIFFKRVAEYSIDYSQEFLDLYLLKSKKGGLAFTIHIMDDFEYDLPKNLL